MICANCNAELQGVYCHNCGQSAADPLRSVRAFAADAARDVVQVHSRVLKTLIGLLTPGFLTSEYVLGRRARYVGPFQVYLFCAAAFFMLSTWRPVVQFDSETRAVHSTLGIMSAGGTVTDDHLADLSVRGIDMPLFAERFQSHVNANLPIFLILSVLLFTLVLRVMYLRGAYKLPIHMVFALHWSAFYLLAMIVDRLIPGAASGVSIPHLIISLITLIYLVIALQRVYRQHVMLTSVKALVIFLAFNAILGAWVAAVVSLAFEAI